MNKPVVQGIVEMKPKGTILEKIVLMANIGKPITTISLDSEDKNVSCKIIYLFPSEEDDDVTDTGLNYLTPYHDPEGTKKLTEKELQEAFIKGCVLYYFNMLFRPTGMYDMYESGTLMLFSIDPVKIKTDAIDTNMLKDNNIAVLSTEPESGYIVVRATGMVLARDQ